MPNPKNVAFYLFMEVGSILQTTSLVKYTVNVCDMYRFFKGEKNDCKMGGALSDLILKLLFIKNTTCASLVNQAVIFFYIGVDLFKW